MACWRPILLVEDGARVTTRRAPSLGRGRAATPRLLDLPPTRRIGDCCDSAPPPPGTILESESRARLIVDNALDATPHEPRGHRDRLERSRRGHFGWSAEEAVGRKLSGLIIP